MGKHYMFPLPCSATAGYLFPKWQDSSPSYIMLGFRFVQDATKHHLVGGFNPSEKY